MVVKNNNLCLWDPQGNGHYATECGHLIYDYGRLQAMQIKVYGVGEKHLPIKIFDRCPKCHKIVKVE